MTLTRIRFDLNRRYDDFNIILQRFVIWHIKFGTKVADFVTFLQRNFAPFTDERLRICPLLSLVN